MSGILNAFTGGRYGAVPGAPTIGTSTATGATTASVAFTAPTFTGGLSITGYQAISTPGCITATNATSPISVTGLTTGTSYTFKVRAQNALGYGAYSCSSNSITPVAPGSQSYTTAGTYTWVAPAGVTKVSVVTVGAGGNGRCGCTSSSQGGYGGGGGALAYKNNISVTPGNSYTVVVANYSLASYPYVVAISYFCSTSVVAAGSGHAGLGAFGNCNYGAGGVVYAGTGYSGGHGGYQCSSNPGTASFLRPGTGGGGSGGYSGSGGKGTGYNSYYSGYCCCVTHENVSLSTGGSGGGGGGGGMFYSSSTAGGGGGGVGILGQGSSGAAGGGGQGSTNGQLCAWGTPVPVYWGASGYRFYSCAYNTIAMGGGGGSGGANGYCGNACRSCFLTSHTNGGNYGGGGGGGATSTYQNTYQGGLGGVGAVRIIWPGNTRSFPSTCTGSP